MGNSFAAALQRFADKTDARLDLVVQETRREIFTRLVLKSPVDTGRFRANWHIERGPHTYTTKKTSVELDTHSRFAAIPISQPAWIINALPYGPVLEYGRYGTGQWATVKTTRDGYSVQAPYGMVRVTVSEFHDVVRDAVALARRLYA